MALGALSRLARLHPGTAGLCSVTSPLQASAGHSRAGSRDTNPRLRLALLHYFHLKNKILVKP